MNFDTRKTGAILHQDTDHAVVLEACRHSRPWQGQNTLTAQLKRDVRCSDADPGGILLDYGTRGPVMFTEKQTAQRLCWRDSPVSAKIYHAWHAGEWKTTSGWRHFHWTGNHAKPPSNVSARGHGSCHGKASLVEWTLLTGTLTKFAGMLQRWGTPSLEVPCMARRPSTQDMDSI